MANVEDVAAYILRARGPMTAMKLQKLAYYSHAWHLVWEERPLFAAPIQAWANGPVVPELYRHHRGLLTLSDGSIDGDPAALSPDETSTIDAVLDAYGEKTAHWLSELTHSEPPWQEAREGLKPMERGTKLISDAAIHSYYHGLTTIDSIEVE